MILYSEFADGFQFSEEKTVLEVVFFVAEIFNKYRNYTFFMRHPLVYYLKKMFMTPHLDSFSTTDLKTDILSTCAQVQKRRHF